MSLNMGKMKFDKVKKLFAGLVSMPSAKQVNKHINEEIINLEYHQIEDQNGKVIGMKFGTKEFVQQHFKRFVESEISKGNDMQSGKYWFTCKAGYDTSKHTRYAITGTKVAEDKKGKEGKYQQTDIGVMDWELVYYD